MAERTSPGKHPTQRRISRNIAMLRMQRGVSRERLAASIGFTKPDLLDQRLNGRSGWKPQELEAVAIVLSVDVGDLFKELELVPMGRLPRPDSNGEPAGYTSFTDDGDTPEGDTESPVKVLCAA